MKRVTYPHLGALYITSEHFFRGLGLVPLTPPFSSRRTLDLGVNHCPEMTCAPCKILFGKYYEGLELGADQLVLFGGPDTCRLGYLARPQAERLRDAGFQFTSHTLSLRGMAADILRVARGAGRPFASGTGRGRPYPAGQSLPRGRDRTGIPQTPSP